MKLLRSHRCAVTKPVIILISRAASKAGYIDVYENAFDIEKFARFHSDRVEFQQSTSV
jgi:hypothetical protein